MDDRYLYDRSYFDGYYLKDVQRDAMYQQEYKRIKEYFPQGGEVLDVGCGVGGFLGIFDDRWHKHGVEPSEFASVKASAKGIKLLRSIRNGDSNSMDVVIFRGTLQHINYPLEYLFHASRILKLGGLLVILATPDADSLVYKIWGNLPALDPERNWVIFGRKSLDNVLKRLGFGTYILHPYFNTPYARPLSDFCKFFISLFFGWRKFAFPGNMMEIYAIKVK